MLKYVFPVRADAAGDGDGVRGADGARARLALVPGPAGGAQRQLLNPRPAPALR